MQSLKKIAVKNAGLAGMCLIGVALASFIFFNM